MTQPRAKPHRLMWVGIVAAIVVVAGVAVLIGIQRARRSPLPSYVESAPTSYDPSSEWTCSRWFRADETDRHTWLMGKLRLLRQLDNLPTATPNEAKDFSKSITDACMSSKTDANLAVVASNIYPASRHTS